MRALLDRGMTAPSEVLEIALTRRHFDCLNMLIHHGVTRLDFSPVHRAVALRLDDAVQPLIDLGFTTDTKATQLCPLRIACIHRNLRIVRMLLEAPGQIPPQGDATSPLHWATASGSLPIVECIYDRYPATVNLADRSGLTPIFYALGGEDLEEVYNIVVFLVGKGARFSLKGRAVDFLRRVVTVPRVSIALVQFVMGKMNLDEGKVHELITLATLAGRMDIAQCFEQYIAREA
jgi:ankyrin repeat protein